MEAMTMTKASEAALLDEDDDLLSEAGKLSGVHDTRALIRMGLESLVQKLEFEKDKKELYAHLEEGLADDEAGRFITEKELFDNIDRKIASYV
jgi:predicted transcriptional regulator